MTKATKNAGRPTSSARSAEGDGTPHQAPHRVDAARIAGMGAIPVGVQVVRAGQAPPAPDRRPVEGVPAYDWTIKPLEEHQTIADRIDYLCDALGGAYHERKIAPDGDVILKMITPDETSYGGKGRTNVEAFNQLLPKVQRALADLEADLELGGAS